MKFFPGDFYIFPGEFLLVCFSETLRRVFSFFLGFLLDYTLEFDYNYNIQVPFSTGEIFRCRSCDNGYLYKYTF